jgi:hypothetical protein
MGHYNKTKDSLQELFHFVGLPADAEIRYWRPNYPIVIEAIEIEAHSAPTSALGTYLLTAALTGGSILAASFDLESLVADTPQTPALTPYYASVAADALVALTATSTNADLVAASGLKVTIHYHRG